MAARQTGRPAGPYRLQAEIAAEHATAATAAATDWVRIVAAYDALFQVQPSPVVALNRAVALGFRDGPDAGLPPLPLCRTTAGWPGITYCRRSAPTCCAGPAADEKRPTPITRP